MLALLVLDGAAVIATYSRFPAHELYHVHHSGIAAGFGRELVALNFPFALVGIALVGLAWPGLHGVLRLLGVAAIALCAVVYVAVHHGQHHGWQATMLVLTALAFSRLPRPRLLDGYLALMLAYGVGNLVNDDWLEQVVKRGWTNNEMPSVLTPAANWGWAAVLVGAVAVWALWFRQPRRTTPAPASPAISSSV